MKQLVNVSDTSSLMEVASALAKLKNCGDILELPLGDWQSRTIEGQLQQTIKDTLSSLPHSLGKAVDQQTIGQIRHAITEELSTSYNVVKSCVHVNRSADNSNVIVADIDVLYKHNIYMENLRVTI